VLKDRTRNSREESAEESDKRTSIDRLRDFTRRIIKVPKEEIEEEARREKKRRE